MKPLASKMAYIMLLGLPLIADAMVTTEKGALCTPPQKELEATVLKVFSSEAVQQQMAASRKVYETDAMGKTPSGRSTLDAALNSISMAMVETAVNGDPARPQAMWVAKAAHSWFGLDVPNSGYGIENPDNVYRHIPMDGSSSYEIRGQLPDQPPAQQSFTLYAVLPGTGKMEKEGSPIIGALDEVEVNADGSFTVTVGPEPAAGRPNHIQSKPQTALLIIRDSLTDWNREQPIPLSVHRVKGPAPGPEMTTREMAARAAALIEQTVPFWVNYDNAYVFSKPVNQVSTPRTRGGGWGYSSSGHFKLKDDEALLITLDSMGSKYLGFQLADPWGVALEYVSRTGSLSLAQTRSSADETITYVIAAKDPGVYNWLDSSGLDQGIFAVRWQGVPASVTSAKHAVQQTKVVKLNQLDTVIQDPALWVSSAERKQQLKQRKASYMRRLCVGE